MRSLQTNDGDPVWRLVNAEDLRSSVEPSTINLAGILLDSELGLVFFVIPYGQSTNIQREQAVGRIGLAVELASSLSTGSSVRRTRLLASVATSLQLVEESARAAGRIKLFNFDNARAFRKNSSLTLCFIRERNWNRI